jgi:hypothetical protein
MRILINEQQFDNLFEQASDMDEKIISTLKKKKEFQNHIFKKTDNIKEMSNVKSIKVDGVTVKYTTVPILDWIFYQYEDKNIENIITLYRGHGYNEGNNFYSPSKEFALEFTRTGMESELTKIKVDTDKIYRHEPLPRGYGREDVNFDMAIKIAENLGLNAIWVDEGHNQPNSVFRINPNKKI